MIPIFILLGIFVLIAVRQIGTFRFQIWHIMLAGAAGVLVTGGIAPLEALKAIDLDVILFLLGVFIIGQALEESGFLAAITSRLFSRADTPFGLLILIVFGMGLVSALLMNDTVAIIGTPVVLLLARRTGIPTRILLPALAFAVTTGSVMSPIGNPQNLLIAIHGGIDNPFVTFFRYLFVPTLLNLGIVCLLLWYVYRKELRQPLTNIHAETVLKDEKLTRLVKISLGLLTGLILVKMLLVFAGADFDLPLTWIALIAASPIIIFSQKRIGVLKRIDWTTLVFFAAMFIVMAAVWNTGFFQEVTESMKLDMSSDGTIMGVSVVLSQLISNVPLVALYLPVISGLGGSTAAMMALAAGSTIAGNLTILGAASNVIIIQNAEKTGKATLGFFQFVRIGIPLTFINCTVYWAWFLLI